MTGLIDCIVDRVDSELAVYQAFGLMDNMTIEIDLQGKVALVTGGGRGIGRAIEVTLAESGADFLRDRPYGKSDKKTAEIVSAKGRSVLAVPADVTDANAVANVVAQTIGELGGLHLLINNAGTRVRCVFLSLRLELQGLRFKPSGSLVSWAAG